MKKYIFALAAAASMAFAESHTHDGFYANLTMGVGYQDFDYSYSKSDYGIEADGVSLESDFKIGGRIANNMILHLTITEATNLAKLELTRNGKTVDESDSQSENMILFGAGLTYYFGDNLFVTGSLGMAGFTLETVGDNKASGSSDAGFGFQVGAGKEWWVADEWGIGVMASVMYGSANDKDDIGEMSALAVSVKFTATFN